MIGSLAKDGERRKVSDFKELRCRCSVVYLTTFSLVILVPVAGVLASPH